MSFSSVGLDLIETADNCGSNQMGLKAHNVQCGRAIRNIFEFFSGPNKEGAGKSGLGILFFRSVIVTP